jgi:asparagine synthase (glutamine-hydrolysing)
MCGIVGILELGSRAASREQVQRMNDCITHRGPDEQGVWTHGPVALAMRRLSIIDLACGQQPMCNEDETVWIVFNGEIYNFPELRQQLEARGHTFRTHSDTETILHAYEEWGEDCPKHLRGMFAFAIYDIKTETLFLARDRVGKKPLLYTEVEGQLLFASEFQAILTNRHVPRRPNLQAIDSYLATNAIPAPLTGFEGIYKLQPGHWLRVRNGEIHTERYWQLDFSQKMRISEAEAADELLRHLEDAVRVRMISEVPLGSFLSGGIDSSAVVAMMAKLSTRPVKTFSIGFKEKEYSEIEHARRLAKQWNTDHTEVIVEPNAMDILPTLVRHYGEPYADSSAVPTFYVSQITRQHVTVALNGDGGDELFAGYERHRAMKIAEAVPHTLLKMGATASHRLPGSNNFRSRSARLKRLLTAASLPRAQRYLYWISSFSAMQKTQLYTAEFIEQSKFGQKPQPTEQWLMDSSDLNIVDACLQTDTYTYLPDDLLVKVDITSMANSLEARSPFLDTPFIEWAAKLPPGLKLKGSTSKYILRKALAESGLVPRENMERPKMGFGVPISHWFQDTMREMLIETVLSERALSRGYFRPDELRRLVNEHLEGQNDHAYRLWALLMLELWHLEFIDGFAPEPLNIERHELHLSTT